MRVGQLTDRASQEMMITMGIILVAFGIFLYFRVGQLAEAAFASGGAIPGILNPAGDS